MVMKAITIWQPWASLIVEGQKGYETRSWYTSYRGPIAIHAAKRPVEKVLEEINPSGMPTFFLEALYSIFGQYFKETLPTGGIVATAKLVDCIRITEEFVKGLSFKEELFGDYTIGRYAWKLEGVKKIQRPIPVVGKQGLWTWRYAE